MAEKDLNEKMSKEPLFKVVRKDGSLKAEPIIKPGDENEDTLLDILTDGLDSVDKSGLTGFGKQTSPTGSPININTQQRQSGLSGIGEWMDSNSLPMEPEIPIDNVIEESVSKVQNRNSNKIVNTINYVIENFPEQFSDNWWEDDEKVIILSEAVAEELNVNVAQVALIVRNHFS